MFLGVLEYQGTIDIYMSFTVQSWDYTAFRILSIKNYKFVMAWFKDRKTLAIIEHFQTPFLYLSIPTA